MKHITPNEVKSAIDSKQDVIILDVRTTGEFTRGKIEGSINLPVDNIFENIETAIPDKNKTIYVYCLSGSRSEYAVNIMDRVGYKNVFNMENGLLAWRNNKLPLVN